MVHFVLVKSQDIKNKYELIFCFVLFLDTGWLGITAKLSPWSRIHGRIARDVVDHRIHGGLFPSMDNHRAPRPISNYITPGL